MHKGILLLMIVVYGGPPAALVVSSTELQQQLLVVPGRVTRDVGVQGFPIVLQILLSDVQHVDLRAGHHDPDQGPVLSASPRHGLVQPLCEIGWSVLDALHHSDHARLHVPGHLPTDALLDVSAAHLLVLVEHCSEVWLAASAQYSVKLRFVSAHFVLSGSVQFLGVLFGQGDVDGLPLVTVALRK